jgi:Gram-negative bacterial TonB protein C-terminal
MNPSILDIADTVPSARSRPPFTERGALRVFVRGDSFFKSLFDSLAAIAQREPPRSSHPARYFVHGPKVGRIDYAGRSGVLSLVLHCALVALLVYLPSLLPPDFQSAQRATFTEQRFYYRIPLQAAVKTPHLAQTRSRSRSGFRSRLVRAAAMHSTVPRPAIPIVSKPAHPDNLRQTIYQSASPPDLKITTEQKLPNIVILDHSKDALKAPLAPNYARPAPVAHPVFADAAPMITSTNPPTPMGTILSPSESNPRLAIPLAGGGAPIQRTANVAEGPPANAPDLVVLGVDPAPATGQLSLPAGNRWGDFTIAPPSETAGSPGGASGGSADKGGAGSGLRATAGTGTGSEDNGGSGNSGAAGPGSSGAAGPVSVAGSGSGESGGGVLQLAPGANLVYAVAQPLMAIRRNTLVISAGPIGGGGLNVYGALNCGKIYSVFLPMPGKDWSLQYCDKSSGGRDVASEAPTTVIHLEKPLVPPDVDLKHRFDFKRIPLPAATAHRPIILKGTIGADGTVQDLVVYKGVSPVMDEAARIAFSRWRFKPAMKDGKPVAVEILVGIPPLAGDDHVNR